MKHFKILAILFFTFLCTLTETVRAQEYQRITASFSAAKFDSVVLVLEQQTTHRFFYNRAWTDSLTLTAEFNQQPVAAVLDRVFQNTKFHYNLYGNSIFITHDRSILTELPVDYFSGASAEPNPIADADFAEFERREKQRKQAEEKLYIIGTRTTDLKGTATLTGTIRDVKNGEPIIGASIYMENPLIGAVSDQFGVYTLSLPKGRREIKVKSVGMKNTHRYIMLYQSGKLDIDIEETIIPLKEVVVESDRDARVTGMQMGVEKLDIHTMKQMPLMLGETDVMKVVLALPGVQSVGEGTVGLNVRGGATNQNLILYNEATVYNPSHMFGFFSTFNPDVLKEVELYKSGITADYGGRLSSVLDVHTREGNLKKFVGGGGISPVTARVSFEGPIVKDKTSFLLGFRSTYSDWLLKQVDVPELKNSEAAFYDFNASINHTLNDKNNFYASVYASKDKFRLNSDTLYSYGDRNASLKWKHSFSGKLYGVFTGTVSQYDFEMSSTVNPVNAFVMDFSIRQWNGKADFSYYFNSKHTFTAGASVVNYSVAPGKIRPLGTENTERKPDEIQHEQGLESAVYIGENFDVNPRLSLYGGLRFSHYQSRGPRDVYTYADGIPKEESTIQDTLYYQKGEPVAQYQGLEPRFSIRYTLPQNASVKFSYNRMRQYIQMISNTTAITPTDIWKLSDRYIQPQIGDQYAIGYYRNFRNSTIETSVEAYYKDIQNATDYKDGAELMLNHHLETEVLQAQGKAYGVELLVKKATGKVNGWISYTYSRSLLKIDGIFDSETINKGQYYPSSYDKPHAFNFIGNYKFNRRFNFSLNVVYSTGRPITTPIRKYELGGAERVFYSDRNQYRIPDYFRIDTSINVEGNHKIKKLAHSSWTLAVYNLTSRANAYSIFFRSENGKINGYKLSVFAKAIPTITYNFKF